MIRNKKIGTLWITIPTGLLVIVMIGYSIVRFFVTQSIITYRDSASIPMGLAVRSPFTTTAAIANVILGFLGTIGIIGMLIGIPVGIYFLAKKDADPLQVANDPMFQGLTPEQVSYINGWSWGAFFGAFVWPLGNKLYWWALGSLVPLWGIYVWIHLAISGRALAWEKSVKNFEHFKRRQKIIAIIIISILIVYFLLQVMVGLLSITE